MRSIQFCYQVGIVLKDFTEEEKAEICREAWSQSSQEYNDYEDTLSIIKEMARNRKQTLTIA